MPVYGLSKDIAFPHPNNSDPDGLLAIGGDLNPERLLLAYANGIFPWFSRKPILWWSPNPRCVLFPRDFKKSKSLIQVIRKNIFEVRFDSCFKDVIIHCAKMKRKGEKGTWITSDMIKAYCKLHKIGFAHSVEVFHQSKLVGGLYGVSLGGAFFGESMFHLVPNASKVALYHLVEFCINHQFDIIDNQVTTEHMIGQGAKEICRQTFLEILDKTNRKNTLKGNWSDHLQ
jgi:leucyl/phenylalanyl-tRNA---protein transferase